jgi:Sec-independent protein translocase protein TatA
MEDLELGVQMIHSNYPLLLTQKGCAINFTESVNVTTEGEFHSSCILHACLSFSFGLFLLGESKIGKRKRDTADDAKALKKAKKSKKSEIDKKESEEKEEDLAPVSSEDRSIPFDSYSINLWDEKYRKDISPLVNCLLHFLSF